MSTTIEYVILMQDKFSAQVAKMEKQVGQLENKTKHAQKTANATGSSFGGMFGAVASIGIGAGLMSLGSEMISITSNFEKYQAVLGNSLGSQKAAKDAMKMISDVASKTPFELNNLTASYVKLVNRGFTPTREEIIKLGDLASSQGKDFDMLTEAILDAETGEFERLKEFGIKSKKVGDNVEFMFKGAKTVVKNDAIAIREYILSIGDQKGIKGGMDLISKTLEGKISNMKDTVGQLMTGVGNVLSPFIKSGLDSMIATMQGFQPAIEQFFKDFTAYAKFTFDNISILFEPVITVYESFKLLFVSITDLFAAFNGESSKADWIITIFETLAFTTKIATAPMVVLITVVRKLIDFFVILWNKFEVFRIAIIAFAAVVATPFIIAFAPIVALIEGIQILLGLIDDYNGSELKTKEQKIIESEKNWQSNVDKAKKRRTDPITGKVIEEVENSIFSGDIFGKGKKKGFEMFPKKDEKTNSIMETADKMKAKTQKLTSTETKTTEKKDRTVTGSAPKIININVAKYFDNLNISTTNMQESSQKIQQIIVETFNGMLADLQPVIN